MPNKKKTKPEITPDYLLEPWERHSTESDQSWEGFAEYRNMGVARNLRAVAEKLGKSRQLMERWSQEHGWVARSSTWDIEQDRLWRESLHEERRKMAERQARTASLAQGKIAHWIVNQDFDGMSPTEAARWYEIATKIEQNVLGLPQVIELATGELSNPYTELSPEEAIARLRDVQGQIESVLGEND